MQSMSRIKNLINLTVPFRSKGKGMKVLPSPMQSDTIRLDGLPTEVHLRITDYLSVLDITRMARVNRKFEKLARKVLNSPNLQCYIKCALADVCYTDKSWRDPSSPRWELSLNLLIESLGSPESLHLGKKELQDISNCISTFSSSQFVQLSRLQILRPWSLPTIAGQQDGAISIILLRGKMGVFSHEQQERMFKDPTTFVTYVSLLRSLAAQADSRELRQMQHQIVCALGEQESNISPTVLSRMKTASDYEDQIGEWYHKNDPEWLLARQEKLRACTGEPDFGYQSEWQKNMRALKEPARRIESDSNARVRKQLLAIPNTLLYTSLIGPPSL